MKHVLGIMMMLALASAVAVAQTPAALMANTKHDLSFTSTTTGQKGASEQICGYCHTPHVPTGGSNVPLWARKAVTTGFTAYTSPTMNASATAIAAGDFNVSAMCMSCHDGSALFASTTGTTGPGYLKRPYAGTNNSLWNTTATVIGSGANLNGGSKYGTGLSHTHPVNFDYTIGSGAGQLPATDFQATPLAGVPLYSGKMQCASCHDVHSNHSGKFVRDPGTDKGLLCVSCHIK